GQLTQLDHQKYIYAWNEYCTSLQQLEVSYNFEPAQTQAVNSIPVPVVVYGPNSGNPVPAAAAPPPMPVAPILVLPVPQPRRERSKTPPMPVRPTQDWTIVDIATKCIPPTYEKVFLNNLPVFQHISSIIDRPGITAEYPYYP